MITKQVTLNQIEITEAGRIQVRLAKQIVDGENILANEWHRTAFDPGSDIDHQTEIVNAHLAKMGYPPISSDDVTRVKAHAATAWTPNVIAAYQRS